MVSATVNEYIETANPNKEIVTLTVIDGYTYTARKFDTIKAAVACKNSDDDAHINVTYSGGVATINYASGTADAVTLFLWGGR